MPAYIVVEIDVHDSVKYEEYKTLTPISLAKYQGRFIVRGGNTESLEGGWSPKRFVVIEFPNKEMAKRWWTSEEYAPARAIRYATATSKMILVEGLQS